MSKNTYLMFLVCVNLVFTISLCYHAFSHNETYWQVNRAVKTDCLSNCSQ